MADFSLEEGLSTLFTLRLTLRCEQQDIDLDGLLLQTGSLTVSYNGTLQRNVQGVIAEIIQGEYGLNDTLYYVTLRPALWQLTLKQDSRIFHQKSVPQILALLLQKHDILSEAALYDPHATRDHVTQKRETDYQFFSRLAAEEGITFWFEQQQVIYSDDQMGIGDYSVFYNKLPNDFIEKHKEW